MWPDIDYLRVETHVKTISDIEVRRNRSEKVKKDPRKWKRRATIRDIQSIPKFDPKTNEIKYESIDYWADHVVSKEFWEDPSHDPTLSEFLGLKKLNISIDQLKKDDTFFNNMELKHKTPFSFFL